MLKYIFTLLLFILAYNANIFAYQIIKGKVIRVSDGDTFVLLNKNNEQHRIRLYGIDCPEKGQDYYAVAKEFAKNKLDKQTVKIEVRSRDRYGRIVGIVKLSNAEILNISLIEEGLAWQYTQFDNSKTYRQAQQKAQESKKNIWSQRSPIAPWEFRKNKTKKKL